MKHFLVYLNCFDSIIYDTFIQLFNTFDYYVNIRCKSLDSIFNSNDSQKTLYADATSRDKYRRPKKKIE